MDSASGTAPSAISKISSFHRLGFKFKKLQGPAANPSPQLHTALQEVHSDCQKQHCAEMSLTIISGVAMQKQTFTTYTDETHTSGARHNLPHQSIRTCFSHKYKFTCKRSRRIAQVKYKSGLIHRGREQAFLCKDDTIPKASERFRWQSCCKLVCLHFSYLCKYQ